MGEMDSEAFKREVMPHLDRAIADNGGAKYVRDIFRLMPKFADFLSGWVACRICTARGQVIPFGVGELRRIHDLVRLRLESESSTS